jgi:tetratricopeptide (TPR) repeat protein
VREARDLARAGDARARDRYLEALKQNPSDVSLRAELADYLWGTGDPTEAEAQMDWLVARGHPRPGFLRYYGLRLFEAGNFVKASQILEKASREGPADSDLLFCLGSARLEKGDFREAEQALRAAAEKSPEQAGVHHVLGNLLNLTARHREAVVELRQAADLDGSSADVWLDLAQALAADGRPAEAEESCRKSIRLAPDRAAAHLTLGRILRTEGKAEEAATELAASRSLYDREEEQAERNRGSAARASQGWVLLRMNRPADALAQFESIPEPSSSAWRGRAEALERLGRREDAIRALERAKSLAPEDHALDYALERLRASRPGAR